MSIAKSNSNGRQMGGLLAQKTVANVKPIPASPIGKEFIRFRPTTALTPNALTTSAFALFVMLLSTVTPDLVSANDGAVVAGADDDTIATVSFDVKMLALDANEGIVAGDVDGDGVKDLVAGRNWFRGGEWTPRPLRQIEDWNGYVHSNGDYLWDVDGDGDLDVFAGAFIPTEVHWYENPGQQTLKLGHLWKQHLWLDTKRSRNEGQLLIDVVSDSDEPRPEWVVNSWDKKSPFFLYRIVPDANAGWTLQGHQLGDVNGHGLAVGDINGDGRNDVLFGLGWYEQPEDPWSGPWTYHADWELHSSLPMLVQDVDRDGRNDLIIGQGHDYGLVWWQNLGDKDGKLQWKEQAIDDSFSQPHTLAWADVDGDGNEDLITGKRVRAHNGKDPGGSEMPCLYYWTIDPESHAFTRHTIDEGHVGCGLQIVAEDLNGDGKLDLATAGKSGTYLMLQK